MFKSKKELAQALIDGRKFEIKSVLSKIIRYDDEFTDPFRYGDTSLNGSWNHYDKVEEVFKPEWYENIPEHGQLCWVSGHSKDDRNSIQVIVKYATDDEFKYIASDLSRWKYATPLTDDEIKQFLSRE